HIVQWAARVGYDGVFVDNSFFSNCYNSECQQGYRDWLKANFTEDEIRRYFTTKTTDTASMLADSSIEKWFQVELLSGARQWRTSHWTSYPATDFVPFFPDTDAYSGMYSCRIE